MQAAYSNPPASKSENLNPPRLSLELQQCRTPRKKMTEFQLAETILELYSMGLIREVVDPEGVARWEPTEKRL